MALTNLRILDTLTFTHTVSLVWPDASEEHVELSLSFRAGPVVHV